MEDFKVWGELYRPKTIAECILPTKMKQGVVDALASGNIPSFIFAGPPGCGKTSLAYAIIGELDAEYLYINASRETSIDVIRDRVVSFCSTVSMTGTQKIVFLDEVDGLSGKALDSLKGTYEEFSHVRFILTTNSLGKVIEAIRSRSTTIEFKIDKTEKTKLSVLMMKRVIGILKERLSLIQPLLLSWSTNIFRIFVVH
jgi:DNA polymerase III delta prime subunit